MFGKLLTLFAATLLLSITIWAQSSSCSCSIGNGGCSASQTCPAGYIAFCNCSASGCYSQCTKEGDPLPEGGGNSLFDLQRQDLTKVAATLSKLINKEVKFVPSIGNTDFELPIKKDTRVDLWAVLEYLDGNGKLTINGKDLSYLKGYRSLLQNGGEFKICAPGIRVETILREINFLSSKNYAVWGVGGETRVNATIEGKTLSGFIDDLMKKTGLIITDN